jgi:hypothetical protein
MKNLLVVFMRLCTKKLGHLALRSKTDFDEVA